MNMINDNLPMASDNDVQEVPTNPAELEALLIELRRLQVENAAIKARADKVTTNGTDSLPRFATYDSKLFASIEDVTVLLHQSGIVDSTDDIVDARYFVKLFGLRGHAQVKDGGVRGRGKLLYLSPEVRIAIERLLAIRLVK